MTVRARLKLLLTWAVPRRFVCRRGWAGAGVVSLTFDDGPDPTWTPAVLKHLSDRGVHATFFVLGKRVEAYPDLFRQIVDAGHEVGNHGYNHKVFDGPAQAEMGDPSLKAMGVRTRLFRPPGGKVGFMDLVRLALAGYSTVLWSFDARDSLREEGKWKGPDPDYDAITDGDIILMHDDNAACARDLPRVLAVMETKGLTAVPVSHFVGRK
jgi:peptidoglycan/xylan/chitin deacetylase (PgdA/CDA1 family)